MVIGKQSSGAYLLRKGKEMFEATPLTIAELLPALDWLDTVPHQPVRITRINRQSVRSPKVMLPKKPKSSPSIPTALSLSLTHRRVSIRS